MKEIMAMRDQCYRDIAKKMSEQTPLLLAAIETEQDFSGVGGTYILMDQDREICRMRPTPEVYVYWKVSSHLLLEMTILILPYLNSGMSHDDFIRKSSSLLPLLDQISKHIERDTSLSPETRLHLTSIFSLTKDYIELCITTKAVSTESYNDFQRKIILLIKDNVQNAAKVQAQSSVSMLAELKKQYQDDWKYLHAVVPTVWPVTEDSAREQILQTVIENDDNLHIVQNIKPEETREQLGRKRLDQYLNPQQKTTIKSEISSPSGGRCPVINYRSDEVRTAIYEEDTSIFVSDQRISMPSLTTPAPTTLYDSMVALNSQIRSDYMHTITQVGDNIPFLYIDEEAFLKPPYELRIVYFKPGKQGITFEPPMSGNLSRSSLAILDIIKMLSSPYAIDQFNEGSLIALLQKTTDLIAQIDASVISRIPSFYAIQ